MISVVIPVYNVLNYYEFSKGISRGIPKSVAENNADMRVIGELRNFLERYYLNSYKKYMTIQLAHKPLL
jgi:hypothetical protein